MVKNKRIMRKIPLFRVNAGPGTDYLQLTKIPEVRTAVLNESLVAIKEGISKNKKSISLFEIANSNYYIELDKTKWKSTLENLLEYFIQKEDYDKCIECRDLIKQL